MRTLKKALSLVLCVVMVMGLLAVNVSAKSINDYNDSKDIKYTEAAEVLSALGVINGKDNGNYDPKGELTRQEAAVIICRLLNVNPAGKSTFTDIKDPFYEPYIGYLQNQGFVNGYGDGRFGPEDKLTGSAFAKMLLVALGYEAETEGMTGPQWEIGVAKLTKKTNMAGGIAPFNPSEIVTREVAAQMSLNALKADMVEYPNNGVNVKTTDGTQVTVNRGNPTEMKSSNSRYANISRKMANATEYYCQLGEDVWESLKLTGADLNEHDKLGRPINKWELNGNVVTEAPRTPVASIYGGTSENNINDALRTYKIARLVPGTGYEEVAISNNVTLNGEDELYCYLWGKTYTNASVSSIGGAANATVKDGAIKGVHYARDNEETLDEDCVEDIPVAADYSKKVGNTQAFGFDAPKSGDSVAKRIAVSLAKDQEGKLVEFFANDDNYITDIVVHEVKVAEVTNVTTASNGDIIYTIAGRTMRDYADPTVKDTIQVAGTLNRGDYVTILRPGTGSNEVNYVSICEKITGVQTGKDKDSKITVDGNTLTVGRGVRSENGDSIKQRFDNDDMFKSSNASRSFYKDQYGYIVHAEEGSSSVTDYAVVSKIAYTTKSGLDDAVVKAVLVTTDGKSQTVIIDKINEVEVKADGSNINQQFSEFQVGVVPGNPGTINLSTNTDYNTVYSNKLVSFTKKSNGHYEIKYGYSNKDTTKNARYTFIPFNSTASNGASTIYSAMSAFNGGSTEITTKGAATVKLSDGNRGVSDSTIFIIRGTKENDFNVYTGFRAVPTVKVTKAVNVSYMMDNNRVKIMYIDARQMTISSSAKDIFYATGNNYTEDNTGGTKIWKLEGILNGEKTTLTSDTNNVLNSGINRGDLFTLEFGSNNYVTAKRKLISAKGVITTSMSESESNYDPYNVRSRDNQILAAAGLATSENIKDITGGSFVGYTWTDSTKIIVIENGNIVEGATMNSISNGDAYYIQSVGTSGADEYTIKVIYVDKDVATAYDGRTVTIGGVKYAEGDDVNDYVDSKRNLKVNVPVAVGPGTTTQTFNNVPQANVSVDVINVNEGRSLYINGDLDLSTASANAIVMNVARGSYVEINGDILTSNNNPVINITDAGSQVVVNLPKNATNANEVAAHFNVTNKATLTINAPDGSTLTIAGQSLYVNTNAVAEICAHKGTINISGVVKVDGMREDGAYSIDEDTTMWKLTDLYWWVKCCALVLDADNVIVNGSLVAKNYTPYYPAIYVNGNLSGTAITASTVYNMNGDASVCPYVDAIVTVSVTNTSIIDNTYTKKDSGRVYSIY